MWTKTASGGRGLFRDADADTPLRIVIFKQDDQGSTRSMPDPRVGSEIDSIEYVNLGGAGESDVLVSWQAGVLPAHPWWGTPSPTASPRRSCAVPTTGT